MTPPDDLLDHLREALAPPPAQAERIALRALAAGDSRPVRTPRLRRLVPAASLVALLTAAAVFFSLQRARPRQGEAVVSIVNVGGMVIATSEDEERPLVLFGAGEPQSSGIILIRHGDPE
jgi:hypothetical protein